MPLLKLKRLVIPVKSPGQNDDTGYLTSLTHNPSHPAITLRGAQDLNSTKKEDEERWILQDCGRNNCTRKTCPRQPCILSIHPYHPARGGYHPSHFINEETQTQKDEVTCPGHTAGVRGRIQTQVPAKTEAWVSAVTPRTPGSGRDGETCVTRDVSRNALSKLTPLPQQTQKHRNTVMFPLKYLLSN